MSRLVLILLLFAAAPSAVAEAGVNWALQPVPPIAELLPPEVATFDPSRYPDTPVVRVIDRAETVFGVSAVTEKVLRIDYYGTVEGVQQYASDGIGWEAGAQTITIRRAATVTADGAVHAFDPSGLQIIDGDTYDVFTDHRELLVSLPGLAPGSWTVIEFERVTPLRQHDAPWQQIVYLQGPAPIHALVHEIRWDEDARKPIWAEVGDLLLCEKLTGAVRCRNTGSIAPMLVDEVVNYYDVLPRFVYGEATTWNQISAMMREGIEAAAADGGDVDQVYRSLVQDLPDRESRIARIFEFVARDVRYLSVSEGRHDIFPHTVATTLANRYGDCKDKSTLLWSLLRKEGLDAHAVLVSTRRDDAEGLPLPGIAYFDHMVVCWDDPGGKRRCLDPTDAYTDPAATSAGIQGRAALVLTPQTAPATIPRDQVRWRITVDATLAFDAAGGQAETTIVAFEGAYAGARRGALAPLRNDERRRSAVDDYQRIVSDRVRPEVAFEGLSALREPLRVRFTAAYENLLDPAAPLEYRENAAWLRDLVGYFIVDNEHYPYDFPGLAVTSTYRFDSGGHWTFTSGGPDLDFVHPFGSLRRAPVLQDDVVQIHTSLTVPARRVPVEEMHDFQRFLRLMQRESRMSISGYPNAE